MVRAPTEVQAAIELRMHHCHGDQRPAQHLKLLAATAALQSTGHLVTRPLPSYPVDIGRARTLGYLEDPSRSPNSDSIGTTIPGLWGMFQAGTSPPR